MASTVQPTSSFFHPGQNASADSLAILHLRRDHLIPTILHEPHHGDTEYQEGHVLNTRFGSYPHSTLIGLPWGSQVLASQVNTGFKGRKDGGARGKKRKLAELGSGDGTQTPGESPTKADAKFPAAAATGFCHVLPPTPETWTMSLPHRTQVVYTPDYSFILQKLQARPGSVVIEAGAGSGSFTHAAARAVFNGYPEIEGLVAAAKKTAHGRVYSFEYHEPRAKQLQEELQSHGLSSLVKVTHRDVYRDGFLLPSDSTPSLNDINDTVTPNMGPTATASRPSTFPSATQIFLDLPAPWLALPHLTRSSPSPLDPSRPIHLCAFLPCIEQAQRAISALRTHGWLEVSMFELAQRRLDVRRDRVGLTLEGLRGVNSNPATVEEAVQRLVEVEKSARLRTVAIAKSARAAKDAASKDAAATAREIGEAERGVIGSGDVDGSGEAWAETNEPNRTEGRAARIARIAEEEKNRKPWQDGRIVVRTEPEIKTHTSYLVFAVLPVEWTMEMEEKCRAAWAPKKKVDVAGGEAEGGDGVPGRKRNKWKKK